MKNDQMTLLGGALQKMRLPTVSGNPSVPGSVAMVEGRLKFSDSGNNWQTVIDLSPDLYAFNVHSFTSVGRTGNIGPTLAQCRSSYASTTWAANIDFFNCVNGVQIWTVPATGRYNIILVGARQNSTSSQSGQVSADFDLVKGEKLRIVVGQVPTGTNNQYNGCGGTAVFLEDGLVPLVVAGGSGGFAGTIVSRTVAALLESGVTGSAGANQKPTSYSNRMVVAGQGGAGFSAQCAFIERPNYLVSVTPEQNGALNGTAAAGATYYTRMASNGVDVQAVTTGFGGFGGGGGGGSALFIGSASQYYQAISCGGGGGYQGGSAGSWVTSVSATPTTAATGVAGRNFVNTAIRNASVLSHSYLISGSALARISLKQG